MTHRDEAMDAQMETLLSPILEILDSAVEGSVELLQRFYEEDMAAVQTLLNDLGQVVLAVEGAQQPILGRLEHAYTVEMLGNLTDTLEEIALEVGKSNLEQAVELVEFQLIPFFRLLNESFYFWGYVSKAPARMTQYYAQEFAARRKNLYVASGDPMPYQVAVVVVAYNHLEMTRRCVESILQHTDFERLNGELILVDHGSNDGTLEYFKSIPFARVIHVKNNMRAAMFPMLPQICRSKYYVHVANDTVVTKDWLKILLTCMESDATIAMACPATCNLSNLQAINVPVDKCEELVRFAQTHNYSDPALWFERARVLPAIGIFSIPILNQIGFWDPALYTFDFCDDDFSLRARRAGYRQILCEDVFCYHRGHGTVAAEQAAEQTLVRGREIFQEKHEVDPWGIGFCYDYHTVKFLTTPILGEREANILAVNCGFGDTPLQLQNILKHVGKQTAIYQITTHPEYLKDITPHAKAALYSDQYYLAQMVESSFSDIKFSYVCIDEDISKVSFAVELMDAISKRMQVGGRLVFRLSNPFFAHTIHQFITFQLPQEQLTFLSPQLFVQRVRPLFSQVNVVSDKRRIDGLEEFVKQFYGTGNDEARATLSTAQYYVICEK